MTLLDDVAACWEDLVEGQGALVAESRGLRQILTQLPSELDAAAAVFVEDRPSVLALEAANLFIASYEQEDEIPAWTIERRPISDVVAIRIQDRWLNRLPGGRTSAEAAQIRHWRLRWPGGHTVTFESTVQLSQTLGANADDAQRFGRILAAKVGWTMPG